MSKTKEELIKLRDCYSLAHDVMIGGTYPGSASGAVSQSVQFLMANYADLKDQVEKMEEVEKLQVVS